MERVTERTDDGYVTTCFWETNTENGMYDLNEQLAEKCIDRLAAYEDTGLTPEEVTDLQQAWDMYGGEYGIAAMLEELQAYRVIGTVAHLAKLVPPNTQLTMEELREMDGEPVYDWMRYEWFVISDVTDDAVVMTDYTEFDIDEDSPNSAIGRFYRRKPEEENDASTLKNIERLLGDVRKAEKSLKNRVYAKRPNPKEG